MQTKEKRLDQYINCRKIHESFFAKCSKINKTSTDLTNFSERKEAKRRESKLREKYKVEMEWLRQRLRDEEYCCRDETARAQHAANNLAVCKNPLHLGHFQCIPLNELQGESVFLFILIISKLMQWKFSSQNQCKHKSWKLKMSYNLFAYKIKSKRKL